MVSREEEPPHTSHHGARGEKHRKNDSLGERGRETEVREERQRENNRKRDREKDRETRWVRKR